MKRVVVFLVLLFFVPLVLSGQISNQTVGGWKIIETSGNVTKANSRIVTDTVWNGNHSQSFSCKGDDGFQVTLEKKYPIPFQKLSRIAGEINVYTKKMNISGLVYAFVSFGNNSGYSDPVGALIIFGSDSGYFYPFSFSLEKVPVQSDRIKIRFVSRGTTDFEIFFDYLYFRETSKDLRLIVDDFEDTTVPVRDEQTIPASFKLFQNYPNPFNPATSIRYEVSSIQYVNITVYDILGREIAILVNEEKFPGSYEVKFDASKLSSGTYFYRLTSGPPTGGYTETKKMILIK